MTAKEIYEEIIRRGQEWANAFLTLLKLFKEAEPEHKAKVLDMLKSRKR